MTRYYVTGLRGNKRVLYIIDAKTEADAKEAAGMEMRIVKVAEAFNVRNNVRSTRKKAA